MLKLEPILKLDDFKVIFHNKHCSSEELRQDQEDKNELFIDINLYQILNPLCQVPDCPGVTF